LQRQPFNADFAEETDFADFEDAWGQAACAVSILIDLMALRAERIHLIRCQISDCRFQSLRRVGTGCVWFESGTHELRKGWVRYSPS
jgi:hypothetical protein